jgi:hypothetical protein
MPICPTEEAVATEFMEEQLFPQLKASPWQRRTAEEEI